MANSNPDNVTFNLLLNGAAFSDMYLMKSATIVNELNRITTATLVFVDGTPTGEDFPLSDGNNLIPGATLEIQAGFDGTNATVFKGIITGHSIRAVSAEGPELVIEARDSAVKMTIARNNACYTNKTDSAIITSLIGNYSGLSSSVDSTSYTWPELVQYYATDWDFMLARAEVNSMYVITSQNQVSVKKLQSGSSVATFTYGLNVYAFTAGMDARRQLSAVSAQGWDYTSQSLTTSTGTAASFPDQGNISATTLAGVTAPSSFVLSTTAPLETDSLQSWANAQLTRSRFAKIRCTLKVLGNATVLPGNCITLAGMGTRFNGLAFVSGIIHHIGKGEFFTSISTGIDDNWFVDKVKATAQPASGLLPGVRGLLNGTVKAITSDPATETRVQVTIPLISGSENTIWCRITNIYATSGTGHFWMPEVGDEVVVGFLNNDPGYPIILGSLYSSQRAAPYTPDDQNSKKAFYSKSKIYIEFDDQNKVLTITTPGNNQVILSDKDGKVTVQDQNNNTLVMSSSGVEITSPKDITLNASGNIKISGTQGVNITSSAAMSLQASTDFTAKGLNATLNGDTQLTVKGGATAELSSGGETSVKGSIVMIN